MIEIKITIQDGGPGKNTKVRLTSFEVGGATSQEGALRDTLIKSILGHPGVCSVKNLMLEGPTPSLFKRIWSKITR